MGKCRMEDKHVVAGGTLQEKIRCRTSLFSEEVVCGLLLFVSCHLKDFLL